MTVVISLLLTACGSNNSTPMFFVPQQQDVIAVQMQQMVETKYAAYKSANKLPENAGVLVYVQSPSGIWLATAGVPSGVKENSHFRIASNTKTFTAAAIMLLDQQGRLRIDDYVTSIIPGKGIPYLPESPSYALPYKSRITIRQLLSHRAGVYDMTNDPVPATSKAPYAGKYYMEYVKNDLNEPDHQFTFDELAGVDSLNQLSYWQPDGGYHYSNTGYTLLAVIIERVTGQSYGQFIKDNLFTTVGLSSTSSPWSANERALPAPFITGYSNNGTQYVETTEDNMSGNVAEGNIISTAADLTVWYRTLLSGSGPVNKDQIARMTAIPAGNESSMYGLGIATYADIGFGHTGAHRGYMSLGVYNPQDNLTVVVVHSFLDGDNINTQGAFLLDLGKQARRIAGFDYPWPAK